MLVNWKIHYSYEDREDIQPPDKVVKGKKYWFFRYWPDADIQVDVIDFSRLPLLHYLEKNKFKFYIFQILKAIPISRNYDLIISHSAQSAVFLDFLRTFVNKSYPPHIVIDPGCFNGARDNKFETSLIRYASQSINGLIYHSTIQEQYYRKHLPFLLRKSRFIHFGTDTEFFKPIDNVPGEDYVISIGYMKRDYLTLLKAWSQISTETKLRIVGIKNLRMLGITRLTSNVELYDRVSISKLKQLIAGAKFVVIPLPYYKYSYGQMTLLQSMAMAKAVIVTKTPSAKDYITNSKDGLFVEPYNIGDMREKIEFLLNNPSLVERLSKQARKTVEQKFNEKIMAQKIYAFVNKIIEDVQ